MLPLLFAIVIVAAVPITFGFITSWRKRHVNRRHFAAFLGFSAGAVAIIATAVYLAAAIISSGSTAQGLIFVSGIIGLFFSLVAFCAGLFSVGIERIMLVAFGPLMSIIYVIAAFSNFGA